MRKLWQQAVNIGVHLEKDPARHVQVQLLNKVTMASIFLCLLVSIFALFLREYYWLLTLLWHVFLSTICLFLTATGKSRFSYKLLAIATFTSSFWLALLVGENGHLEQIMPLIYLVASVFAYSKRELTIWLIISVVGMLLCVFSYELMEPIAPLAVPSAAWSTTMTISMVMLCILAIHYRKDFERKEQIIREKNEILHKESKRRKIDSKEIQLAQIALRENEAKYKLIFDHAIEGILLIDAKTMRPVSFNSRALDLFKCTEEEFYSINKDKFLHINQADGRDGREILANWYHRVKKGERVRESWQMKKMNGELMFAEVTCIPMPKPHRNLVAFFIRDISQEKEEEARRLEAVSELEEVNDELKSFAYIVSHDLKAPLRAIGSLADWLEADYKDQMDDQGKEIVELINGRVGRMHKLIEGILSYSRVSRDEEEKSIIDTHNLIEQVIYSLDPPEHINIEIESPVQKVHFERTRLTQLFQNLISNSITFMDKSKGLIKIGGAKTADNISFYVEDNGPGIDETYYDKVFQIFQTLQARDSFETMGIGLAIVKKIVDRYGGEITLESRRGKGCKFTIILPRTIVEPPREIIA